MPAKVRNHRCLISQHLAGGVVAHVYVKGRMNQNKLRQFAVYQLCEAVGDRHSLPIILSSDIRDGAVEAIMTDANPSAADLIKQYAAATDPSDALVIACFLRANDPTCVTLLAVH